MSDLTSLLYKGQFLIKLEKQLNSEMGNKPSSESVSPQAQRPNLELPIGSVVAKEVEKPRQIINLPHNYETILRDADQKSTAPCRTSSLPDKLLEQLQAKVYLSQKKRMYWVEKNSIKNCFMLFARDLSITWSDESRYWHWQHQNDCDVSFEAAELVNVCWLEIHGIIDTTMLSPETLYEVAFVIMLKDQAYGWQVPVNVRLGLPSGNKQERVENLMNKPREQWIEIPAGEFRTSPENLGKIEISLFEYQGGIWKKGLVIKGIVIRPKN
ncbi:LOW QUALITY PROTEIN: lectin-like [Rutidosis leptorrhynchoides]|uniref:LOW QUALITY PROTEIN: lectin-like n=1 Tax=Rutidosis leptorrhynchoides TaxID=125765 RepID=UPI003A994A8F